jgi:5-methylcytosine-specific restriction protein A
MCQAEGHTVSATDVDHITPHKGNKELFYDVSNLQSLCHSHHSQKTAKEDGGFGNKIRGNH